MTSVLHLKSEINQVLDKTKIVSSWICLNLSECRKLFCGLVSERPSPSEKNLHDSKYP